MLITSFFLPLAVFVIIAFLIAHFIGKKRRIGFGWSFFFSIFLTPIGGLIASFVSPKDKNVEIDVSSSKRNWGIGIIILFTMSFFGQVITISKGEATKDEYNALFLAIGFIGLGFYLIELSKGKNFRK